MWGHGAASFRGTVIVVGRSTRSLEGVMATHSCVDLHIPEAQLLADVTGIKADLERARETCAPWHCMREPVQKSGRGRPFQRNR